MRDDRRHSGCSGDESVRFEFFGVRGEGNDLTATAAGGEMREHLIALVAGERVLSEGAELLGLRMRTVLGGFGHEPACSGNA